MNFGVSRFRKLLPVACASLAMTNVADLVDVMIAGRILGETALGAVQLVWPIVELLFFFATTLASGTAIRYSIALGAFDKTRASRWFSNGLLLSLGAGLVFAAAMALLRNACFAFFGIGADVIGYVVPYWNVFLLQAVLAPLNIFLSTLVCADGDTRCCTAAFVTELLVNVAATWCLCLAYGTAGCALGTVGGTLCGIIVLSTHFRSASNSLKFTPYFSLRDSWEAFAAEFPASSAFLFTALMFVLMNKLLVDAMGDIALTVMAVISMANNFMMFLYGIPNAAQPLVGVAFGERNYNVVRVVMKDALLVAALFGGALTAALVAFPVFPGWVIGVETPELVRLSATAVRITSCSYVFTGIGTLILTYYLFIRRQGPSMALTVLQEAVFPVLGCVIGLKVFGYLGFWVGYALAPLLAMVAFFAVLALRQGGRFNPFLLPEGDARLFDWNVFVDERTSCEVAQAIHAKLESLGAEMKTVVKGDMLVEDTLMTIKERNPGRKVRAEVTLDCRDGVKLVFRDDGKVVTSFTDSGGGDWLRAQTLGAVIGTVVGRNSATTCGYNRAEYCLERGNLI